MVKKVPGEKSESEAAKKKRIRWIAAAITAGTLAAIVALSIVTKGQNNMSPGLNVIITRIVLLTVTTGLYFFMLFRMSSNGKQKEPPKPKSKKK